MARLSGRTIARRERDLVRKTARRNKRVERVLSDKAFRALLNEFENRKGWKNV